MSEPAAPALAPQAGARAYALRRLNPFRGVVQIVETGRGRALSMNGRVWEVHARVDVQATGWGSLNRRRSQARMLRLGFWERQEGLRRAPIDPSLDRDAVIAAGAEIAAALSDRAGEVPFDLADPLEQWLMGRDGRPLALLAALPAGADTAAAKPAPWRAAAGIGHGFVSRSLTRRGIDDLHGGRPGHHAQTLEQRVQAQALPGSQRSQWFLRGADGAATAVADGRRYPGAWLPSLPLRENGLQAADAELAADYIAWLAPRLLCLPDLKPAVRERLEQAARANALLVDALHRLYPSGVDPDFLVTARVEARMRRVAGDFTN